MKNNKKRNNKSKFLLVILLLGITVGFALLTATLSINGNGKINKANWYIHWDNVEVRNGSVAATTPAYIKDQNKTIVEYSVVFEKPGDFYEFTVDAVNDGTIDGQVSIVSNEVLDANDQVISNPTNIVSSVTYSDGKTILPNQLLKVGRREKYKVRVSYDADETNLIANDTEFKFRFSVTYVQSDNNGTIRDGICNATIYNDGDLTESRYLDLCDSYIDEDIYTYTTNNDGSITLTGFKEGYTISQVKSTVRDITASKLVNDSELEAKKVVNNVISFKDGVWAIPVTIGDKKVTKITEDAFTDLDINAELVLPPTLKETADGSSVYNQPTIGTFAGNNITAVGMPYNIVKIGAYTFSGNKLTKAEIRDSVQVLGEGAFNAMNSLTSVSIGKGVDTINSSTFAADGITTLTVPGYIKSIGSGAFYSNPIETLVIEDGVKEIQGGAFGGISAKKIVIPDSVTLINGGAFYNTPVEELIIGDGVTQLGYGDFSYENLKKLVVGDGMVKIGAIGSTPDLTDLDLGNSVQTITDGSFYNCKITKLTFPDSVTVVTNGSFNGCTLEELDTGNGLTDMNSNNNIPWSNLKKLRVGTGVRTINISNTPNLEELTLENGVQTISSSFGNSKITKIKLPDSVTNAVGSFSDCANVTEIDTGDGITEITNGMFGGTTMNNLKKLIVGDSVTAITNGTINGATKLEEIVWGSSITTITNGTFSNVGIKRLVLPDTVTRVDGGAFSSPYVEYLDTGDGLTTISSSGFFFSNLKELVVGDSVTTIDGGKFSGNTNLTKVTFGSSLKTIGNGAFYATGLTEVDLSNTSIELIGNEAFKNCSITDADFAPTIKTIGNGAFQNANITSLNFSQSALTTIGQYAFQNNNISDMKLGDNLITIGDYAFENNDLDSVSLPNTVKTIGDGAFGYNSIGGIALPQTLEYLSGFNNNSIGVLNIPATVTVIGDHAFSGNNIINVTIPANVTEIKREAFGSNQIATLNWSSSVETIGNEAFRGNRLTSLPSLTNVQNLGDGAFASNNVSGDNAFVYDITDGVVDNTTLNSFAGYNRSVTLPSTVTKLSNAAFFATSITGITNYSQLTSIGDYAFGNTSITSFTMPSAVTELKTGTFFSTPYLTSIDLGNVESIGPATLEYSRLTSLTIPATVTSISNNAIPKRDNSNPGLTTITNNTGRAFDWNGIINGTSGTAFETGTVVNDAGNVTITN